jgi:hypothetical protein
MHHAVRELTVVGEEEQPFRVAVEPADRVEALRGLHQLHHGLAIAVVAGGGNESARFVEHDVTTTLRPHDLAVDPDFVVDWIGFGTKLGDGCAVHRNPARNDHLLGYPA